MRFIINGKIRAGITEMWRIDDMMSGLVGLEMLQNPTALVIKKSDAELICNLLNNHYQVLGQT